MRSTFVCATPSFCVVSAMIPLPMVEVVQSWWRSFALLAAASAVSYCVCRDERLAGSPLHTVYGPNASQA
jgi:hypothetical protein